MNTRKEWTEQEMKEQLKDYEDLILKRDQLLRDAGSYQTAYSRQFGELVTANFELKIECIKKKKTISYCRRRINRGLPVDGDQMGREIDREMQVYYVGLKDMIRAAQEAKNAKEVSEHCAFRSKKIYRRLAKVLHPDINQNTMTQERLRDLWERIRKAYSLYDSKTLEDLEVLTRMVMEDLGEEAFEVTVDDPEERIERLEREIAEIVTTEPYTYRELLEDEERKKTHMDELLTEHEDYEQYLESLSRTLEEMLQEGGVKWVWKTS